MNSKQIGIAVAGVAAVGLLVFLGQREDASASVGVNPIVGDGNLTVFLFEDYQCGHCQAFSLGPAHEHLIETWVDPGHIRIVYKHVAFVGPYSGAAARGSQCAYQADAALWPEWDHAVYQYSQNGGAPNEENLFTITRGLGFDTGTYSACMRGPSGLNEQIRINKDEFDAAGATGTPSMIVAGQVLNPMNTAAVDAAIQGALDAA